ncbi:hypothetical protein Dsin_032461 [Dipteronia sinensis]|uniref:Uncharacterized protein n=1 Tax=Dipteronia sinensis TaxID=43782 RepID=A0AAD9ZPE4_9ROSI|nr:hypothetical protein Dsin_032461 [Dipteronia sinensis]
MRECMDIFCDISGQQVSFPKSRIYWSSNISNCNARALADLCGSLVTKNLGFYLGVPLIHGRITKNTYKEILVKTQKRLTTWKSASFSLAGRCTLIKSVTSALHVYVMQSIKLPSGIYKKLDKINRDFLWGSSADIRKMHLINWATVCLQKNLGGLGIKNTKLMNQVLLAKFGWRLDRKDVGFWGRVLKEKYLKGDIGKLQNFAFFPLSEAQNVEKVCDYLVANEWDVGKLSIVLPWHIVLRIFSIHVASHWNYTEDWWKSNFDNDIAIEMKNCSVSWSPPPSEWVKPNMDGSMILESGAISAGGVVRDHGKNWLIGFILNKGT